MMKSLITVSSLINKLEEESIPVCGICDENLYGVMEFYNTCLEHHIKPIIGLEVEMNHLPFYLYTRNYEGYLGLLKIHTKKEKGELGIIDIETWKENLNIVLPYAYIEEYSTYESHLLIFILAIQLNMKKIMLIL